MTGADGGGEEARPPGLLGLVKTTRTMRRSSWSWAEGEGVAMENGVGDDELRSGACREQRRGRAFGRE